MPLRPPDLVGEVGEVGKVSSGLSPLSGRVTGIVGAVAGLGELVVAVCWTSDVVELSVTELKAL